MPLTSLEIRNAKKGMHSGLLISVGSYSAAAN